MKSKHAAHAATWLVLLVLPSLGRTASPGDSTSSYDEMVLWAMHETNQHETELANLAKSNSSSKDVKDFASRIMEDHRNAEARVQTYARHHDMDLAAVGRQLGAMTEEEMRLERRARTVGSATGEWAWSWEHAVRARSGRGTDLGKLRKRKGVEFDRAFARTMAMDHRDLIDRLTDARPRTGDPEARSLIDDLLSTLRQHLAMAEKLQTLVS